MASEEHDTGAVSFAVPQAVGSWIDDQATRRGQTRDEFCRQLLAAVHAASSADGADPIDPIDPIERADLEELASDVDAQREEFVELLEDVRRRVVQVKRETDAKAPADHDHSDYATAEAVDELRERVDELEEELATLQASTDAGFDNVETVLTHVVEETSDVEERSTVLANAVVNLRDHHDGLMRREHRRAEVERLQLAANRLGVRRAACDACSSSVTISLLTRPECPHCGRSFADVEKKTSLFGSHTLVTGDPPALEGDVGEADGQVGRGSESDESGESDETSEIGETDETGDDDGHDGHHGLVVEDSTQTTVEAIAATADRRDDDE